MMITKKSMFSGVAHTMYLPVTQAQLERWQGGELVQKVFPFLSVSEREFLMTGVTADEWAREFSSPPIGIEDSDEDEDWELMGGIDPDLAPNHDFDQDPVGFRD